MDLVINIILLILLVILTAFFAAAETAIMSVNMMKVKHLVHKKVKNAKLLEELKEDTTKTISTLLIGNTLVVIAASTIAASIAIEAFGDLGVGISTAVMTFILLVFGEITPKTIASEKSEKIALQWAKAVHFLIVVISPMRAFLDIFTKMFSKMFGVTHTKKTVTEEEIKSILHVSEKDGEIHPEEKTMINNIFKFNDIDVGTIMTPRADCLSFESQTPLKAALAQMLKSGYSRFPVYDQTIDNIVGVVHIKDLIKNKKRKMTLEKISMKPFVIPNSKKTNMLLREFQKTKTHMAIIVDEYGSFLGVVTIEDLLELIVGDIYDEQDIIQKNIKEASKNIFIVHGDTTIKEINKALNCKIKYSSFEPISAFLLEKMGKIPVEGDFYNTRSIKYTINEINQNRIHKIKITKK